MGYKLSSAPKGLMIRLFRKTYDLTQVTQKELAYLFPHCPYVVFKKEKVVKPKPIDDTEGSSDISS